METQKDIAFELANYIVKTRFENIPSEVIQVAKAFFLDSLGVAVAGSTAPGSKEVVSLVENWGGCRESTIWMSGKRVPAPNAALANGVLIHSRDFDDTHDDAVIHAFASVLPSALATAEQKGNIDGTQLITAIVIAVDLTCRLGLSLKFYKGWHYSAICGGFGAAAAASKILGFNEQLTSDALGIVYSQIAGNVQCVRDGALTKRMQPGFAAKAGVLSAYLANLGITGTQNTFQGPYGFFRLYDGDDSSNLSEQRYREHGQYGQHEVLNGLGIRYEVINLGMKPYPSCRASHPAIEGVIELCKKNKISAEQIRQVKIIASARTLDRVGRPFKIDKGPMQVKAQFSIPYTVAVAIIKGDVFIDDFEEENIINEYVIEMARKVSVVVDHKFSESLPIRIEIETINGRYSTDVHKMIGSPENPLSEEQRLEKFRKCFLFSAKPFSDARIQEIIQAVNNLESTKDVREITALLS
jgi:2-methylcitrate dehydratase PrpD